jgi:UDP-N-acetylglucosamine--N-acetylmuramyl-(pentapeptide) pyrophosphoryl-undecaprenol N-acetylglucosamine transferase
VGLGGYASVPMAWAASRRGVPLVLLEQNAVPGRATRWLARRATVVCLAMAQAQSKLSCRCPVQVTGNPIRAGFHRDPCRQVAASAGRRLVVLGGSGGAESLNQNVPLALAKVRRLLAGWQIVHQSGEAGVRATAQLYGGLGLPATVRGFVADMPRLLAGAELAVCRAGGTTLAELAAAGVPAVLVPYPHAADDHQRHNAKAFSAGAVTVDSRRLPGPLHGHLAAVLWDLLGEPGRLKRMSAAMYRLARPRAAGDVAELILAAAHRSSRQWHTFASSAG